MAAGDAGGAIGAAMETYYQTTKSARAAPKSDAMRGSLLGYQIQDLSKQAAHALKELGGVWTEIKEAELPEQVAALLADGKIVGVARGKAEFDPRTLGNRSILAGARDPDMLQMLNMKIKFREGFRPFAPVVLQEDAADYFETNGSFLNMLFTFLVKAQRRLPIKTALQVE